MTEKHCVFMSRVFGSRHGGSVYSEQFVRSLLKEGWKVAVFAELFGPGATAVEEEAVSRHFLKTWFRSGVRAAFARVAECVGLVRWLRRERASLMIVQGDLPRLSYLLLQQLVPLIFIRQDAILTCPANDRFLTQSRTICEKCASLSCLKVHRREGCFGDAGLVRRIGRIIFRVRDLFLLRFIGHFVVNSRYMMRMHRREALILYPPCTLAPDYSTSPASRSLRRLVFCGRLEAVKGAEDALRIFALLPDDFGMDIVGDGPLRTELVQQSQAGGMANRVVFHGWVSQERRDKIMAGAGVVIVPSLCDEAFGMAGPEAFVQGTPVVAYDAGGIREWCRLPAGTLVGCGDIRAAAEAVLAICASPTNWSVASAAAKRAAGDYSLQAFHDGVVEIVRAVAKEAK